MALVAGDLACTTGLSKRIYDAWTGEPTAGLVTPLAGASAASVKAICYATAVSVVAEINANLGSTPPTGHASSHAAAGSDPVTLTQAQITGLVTALAAKVDTGDARLSDARTPIAHAHPESDITGLVAALAALATALAAKTDKTSMRWTTPTGSITGLDGTDGNADFVTAVEYDPDTIDLAKTGVLMLLGVDFTYDGPTKTITYLATTNPRIPINGQDWHRVRGVPA